MKVLKKERIFVNEEHKWKKYFKNQRQQKYLNK